QGDGPDRLDQYYWSGGILRRRVIARPLYALGRRRPMLKLSEPELREFGIRGYIMVRDVIPPAILAAASTAIDRLVDEQPPPEGHAGPHFYWLSTLDGGPLP